MHNVVRTVCILTLLGITPAYASGFIQQHVNNARIVGQGRLSVMIWDVYDATLFAPEGQWTKESPFALRLSYLRTITGRDIVDHTIELIRDQGINNEILLADWHSQLMAIIPTVHEGTSLTGISTKDGRTIFFENDREIGRITDTEFGKYFFNIWLGKNTTHSGLRSKLLPEQSMIYEASHEEHSSKLSSGGDSDAY